MVTPEKDHAAAFTAQDADEVAGQGLAWKSSSGVLGQVECGTWVTVGGGVGEGVSTAASAAKVGAGVGLQEHSRSFFRPPQSR